MSIDNPTPIVTLPLAVASGGTASTSTSGALSSLGVLGSTVGMQRIVLSGVISATSAALPANSYISQIFVKNNSANAVTGGLKFGTASGGVDIVAALPVAASVYTVPASLLLSRFPAAQTIFIDAVAAWNSANVDITIVYGQL